VVLPACKAVAAIKASNIAKAITVRKTERRRVRVEIDWDDGRRDGADGGRVRHAILPTICRACAA
jgi:hypothetical protein